MKNITIIALILFVTSVSFAQQADDIIGKISFAK